MEVLTLIFLLICGHYVCDFVFQGDVMSDAKSPMSPKHQIDGFPPWGVWMVAHGSTHALAVYLATGSVVLGLIEWANHMLIDTVKCYKKISLLVDQAAHVAVKLGYVYWLVS